MKRTKVAHDLAVMSESEQVSSNGNFGQIFAESPAILGTAGWR